MQRGRQEVLGDKMAASMVTALRSGVRSLTGSFRGTVLRPPMVVETPRSLRTATPSSAAPKKDDPKNRSSMFVGGAKAQNPMKKVGFAWVIGFPSGILLFLLAKNKVDRRRLEQMRTRQRMRDANKGVYMSERFTRTA